MYTIKIGTSDKIDAYEKELEILGQILKIDFINGAILTDDSCLSDFSFSGDFSKDLDLASLSLNQAYAAWDNWAISRLLAFKLDAVFPNTTLLEICKKIHFNGITLNTRYS